MAQIPIGGAGAVACGAGGGSGSAGVVAHGGGGGQIKGAVTYAASSHTYAMQVPPAAPSRTLVPINDAGDMAWVSIGKGAPPGVKQLGTNSIVNTLNAADSTAELYYVSGADEGEPWWNVSHAPDKLSAVVSALIASNWELRGCAFYAHEAPAARECVTCLYATASVGNQCRYCAGAMPSGWELGK